MADTISTLFHFSFAVDDLAQARKFYGEILGCPEGRDMPGRADFNFFGHHIVAQLSPAAVIGEDSAKVARGVTPIHHFGAIVPLDEFQKIEQRLVAAGADFLAYLGEAFFDGGEVFSADDLAGLEHARMGKRTVNVEFRKAAVEVDRSGEAFDEFGNRFAETSGPQRRVFGFLLRHVSRSHIIKR